MRLILSILVLIFFFNASAKKYWFFVEEGKLATIEAKLEKQGCSVDNKSEWLNAFTADVSVQQYHMICSFSEIQKSQPVRVYEFESFMDNDSSLTYVDVLEQVNAKALHEAGLTGRGVKVGVVDAGFVNVDSSSFFKHLQENNQIAATKDFYNPKKDDFYEAETKGCKHGREVLKRITGFDTKKKMYRGVASDASFYLARTEYGDGEFRVEEDHWVAAIEWLHSQGVRLVNTSLGYATDFDDPVENYIPNQMNGETALITKAAQIAVEDKGMIIVVSAGNMGAKEWRILTAPADAKAVISVGATKRNHLQKIGYSSIGPEFLKYVKPEVSCFSPTGTSYSAPVITGIIACMLQKDSTLSTREIKEHLIRSAHLYPAPNNFLGYGVPNCEVILTLMDGESETRTVNKVKAMNKDEIKFEIEDSGFKEAVLFHKSSKVNVLEQEIEKVKVTKAERKAGERTSFFSTKGTLYLKVSRKDGAVFTTVQAGDNVYEIEW